ncbi:MAG: hypothetical protein AB8H86_12715 [Polyangiales bacterium]
MSAQLSEEDATAPSGAKRSSVPAQAARSTPTTDESQCISFPTPETLRKAYEDLLGDELSFRAVSAFDPHDSQLYLVDLLDDNDEAVGVIGADLRAVVFQAGALTMMAKEEREMVFQGGEPNEDMMEAMKELFTVHARCFCGVPGNPHVRTGPIRRLTEDDTWLATPAASMALQDGFDGRMLLASR